MIAPPPPEVCRPPRNNFVHVEVDDDLARAVADVVAEMDARRTLGARLRDAARSARLLLPIIWHGWIWKRRGSEGRT